MKAVRVLRFRPPSVIMSDDLPRPQPAVGELLVRVKAAGVGNWDALVREGKIAQGHLPLILGYELSGIVEAIGLGTSGFKPGDEVYGAANEQLTGAYAEYATPSAQDDGAKTKDFELSRGGLGSGCDCHGLADAIRLWSSNRRTDHTHPWGGRQRGHLRRTTGKPGWP